MRKGIAKRAVFGFALATMLSTVLAVPAMAWVAEGGTKWCNGVVSFVHFRYNDIADVQPPGSSTIFLYRDNDGIYHTRERNGPIGGGEWAVFGDPALDLANTWPGCRNFG